MHVRVFKHARFNSFPPIASFSISIVGSVSISDGRLLPAGNFEETEIPQTTTDGQEAGVRGREPRGRR